MFNSLKDHASHFTRMVIYILYSSRVPSLDHNNKVTGDSLDLAKYVYCNFNGPSLLPDVCCEVSLWSFLCRKILCSKLINKILAN